MGTRDIEISQESVLVRRRIFKVVVVAIVLAIMIVPLITQNHIYQGVALGGDTMNLFIPMMSMATSGASFWDLMAVPPYEGQLVQQTPYLGLALSMWILGVSNRVLSVNPEILFFIYSLVVLFMSGVTLYYLGKLAVGERGGWIVLAMGMVVNTSILALYTWGCTVNILNVYIVLFWGIMMLVRWVQSRKWWWLVVGLALMVLFCVLHPTGGYLPFASAVLLAGMGFWWLKTKRIEWRLMALLVALMVGGWLLGYQNADYFSIGTRNLFDWDYLGKFVRLLLVPIPTVIGLLILGAWIKNRKGQKYNTVMVSIVCAIASLFVALFGASLLQATLLPERQILDASAMFAIVVAVMLAYFVRNPELQWLKVSSYLLMSLQGLITVRSWVV